MSKNKNTKKKIIVKLLILLIILVTFLIIIFIKYKDYLKTKSEINKLLSDISVQPTDTKTEMMLKLEELQKINSDIVAWLKIEDTSINFPVLQTTDNDYYMTHTYNKEYSKDGSIFLDKNYDWNLPSTNLLIYGHNYNNKNMFSTLLDYKNESYYKEHPIIKFTTTASDSEYEIISVFLSQVYYKSQTDVFKYYFFINAQNEEEFNSYIKNSKELSLYDTGKTAEYGDSLITLSTCSQHVKDGRLAIVARKVSN